MMGDPNSHILVDQLDDGSGWVRITVRSLGTQGLIDNQDMAVTLDPGAARALAKELAPDLVQSGSVPHSLERIADALEAQAANDPLAVLGAALGTAPGEPLPERHELKAQAHSVGGGRWVATVKLGPLVPGWSLDIYPDDAWPGGVIVVLNGPSKRYTLTAEDE